MWIKDCDPSCFKALVSVLFKVVYNGLTRGSFLAVSLKRISEWRKGCVFDFYFGDYHTLVFGVKGLMNRQNDVVTFGVTNIDYIESKTGNFWAWER